MSPPVAKRRTPHGRANTKAEVERRVRAVEQLIASGRTRAAQVCAALEELGFGHIPERTVKDYIAAARENLAEEDRVVRAAQQRVLMEVTVGTIREIAARLRKKDVAPKWSDLNGALALLGRFVAPPPPEATGHPRQTTEGKTREEVVAMTAELLRGMAPYLSPPDPDVRDRN